MAITTVVKQGSSAFVAYDGSKKLFQILAPNGVLVGYTSTSVSIKQGIMIYVYNEKGIKVDSHYV
ncbi:hypothetical protein HT665_07405 [Ursidibacter maritimus]|uniref:Uncharacterized protein n=1 Tax=Ursidibacter maritimus TaxID=1331689 RepID=A0A949T779_9PAST|nr:hypothetical protein [Ursidibacter maritimus]KAE9538410.1 hypothetical protein A1D26_06060 [Ursidibacter maritimus]MBV6523457.1 hypothetical protein [Ursidibacter maritimus]MBV6525858.1 hypothetical protein [Ursidibacter maritimus]MBV6528198.1 hypothetical protein [Ursidibacter maritimus]MBV6529329.1 hypothetical protein [Ursidibacter maritimus]